MVVALPLFLALNYSQTQQVQRVQALSDSSHNLFQEGGSALVVRNPKGRGRVVIFHDSFGGQNWELFFPVHFAETVFTHLITLNRYG